MTFGACTVGAIEGKAARLQFRDIESAVGTRHGRGVKLLACGISDEDQTICQLECLGNGRLQTLFDARLEHDAIDDGLNGVVLPLLERDGIGQVAHLAIHPGLKPLLIKGIE